MMRVHFFDTVAMDATERRRLHGIVLLLLLTLSLPYLWAWAITPQGFVYGGLLYNPDDQNVHLSWARQAAEGSFFFRDLFTHESLSSDARPLFTNLFCWFMGAFSGLTGAPLVVVYHGLRLLSAALALYSFYALCVLLTNDRRVRLIALLLAAFACGLGWLQIIFPGFLPNRIFIDLPDGPLMMPEAFVFTSAFVFPLFIVSLALLALVYGGVLRAAATGQLKYAWWAGAAALLLGNIHTYDALPLCATLLVWPMLSTAGATQEGDRPADRRRVWLASLIVIGCALVPVAYQWLVFQNNEEFRLKALTPTPAPPPLDIALSYGPLLVLAVIGALVSWKSAPARLMIIWTVATLLMIYAPVSFARKMIEGLHLPLCFLAAGGLVWLLARVSSPLVRRVSLAGAVSVMSVSSLCFVDWCLDNAIENNLSPQRLGAMMPPLYLPAGDAAALRELDEVARSSQRRDRVVLCLPFLGSYVPRETGSTVYVGHWAETLRFYDPATRTGKITEAQRFYSGRMAPAAALAWLRTNHIGYVVEGFYEKLYAKESGWSLPARTLGLTRKFEHHGTAVYEVPVE